MTDALLSETRANGAFRSEEELQRRFVQGLSAGRYKKLFGRTAPPIEKPSWSVHYLPPGFRGSDIPDVVLVSKNEYIICELKADVIGFYALQQICRYLERQDLRSMAGNRRITGFLIGHHMSRNLDRATLVEARRFGAIRVCTYALSQDGHLQLTEIST